MNDPGGTDHAGDALVTDWQTVASAVSSIQRRVDGALERSGVPSQWFVVLYALLHAEDHRLPMSRLAREARMTTGGFTKLADRMARDGLIDRRGSADDRRVVHAALSVDGLAMAQRAARVYAETLRAGVLNSISRADLAATASAMRVLSASADDLATPEVVVDDQAVPTRRRRRDDRT